ncbi:MAG: WD40-repeat-containing domain protein [Benniella sp.]|nr:MAG: WD40-repeat-containing domain protein [Benniella sp.]
MTLPSTEPLAPADTNTATSVALTQKRAHTNGPMTRGKENDENRLRAIESKSKSSGSSQSASAEETIDIESVDGPGQSDTEYTEDGRPIRKRKATIPFDEDTDMDTDELLEKEVKTKKKPLPKPKAVKPAKVVKDEGASIKAPKKTSKKPTRSAFSDDEDVPASPAESILSKLRRAPKSKAHYVRAENPNDFDPTEVYRLARQYPDTYWRYHAENKSGMISKISEDHPLQLVDCNIHDQAAITGMSLSPDGSMLATFCNLGSVRIWSLDDYSLVKTLRDAKEEHIDEFYVGTFAPDQTLIIVGGKRKDRNNWSEADDDNNILPCPLKLFDVITGEVIVTLEGHTEELLCVKRVQFKGENYFLSGSQDGYLNKWKMGSDWRSLESMAQMVDGVTCMAFTVSFVPNTGNKYFLAAADENLRLYDFEKETLLQTFDNMYSSYCDCGKFITAVDFPLPPPIPEEAPAAEDGAEEIKESIIRKGKMKATEPAPTPGPKPQQFAYFISRGVELLDSEERMIAKDYNSCTLHKLVYPDTKGGKWYLTEVKRFQDEEYFSNAWLIKIASNGRYIMAPTCTGEVFIFNLKTGQVTGILKDHDDVEVRDIIFHPTRPLLFTSADDGIVKVYTYKNPEDRERALKESRETEKAAAEAAALVSVATDLSAVSVQDDGEETE